MRETIEQFLFSYRDARREIETIQAKRDILETEMLPKSPSITGMPSSRSHGDKMGEYMARLEDYAKALDDAYAKALEELDKINAIIGKVEDASLRQLLTYRYLKGYKWDTIADAMGYNKRQLFRFRIDALDEIERMLDDGK